MKIWKGDVTHRLSEMVSYTEENFRWNDKEKASQVPKMVKNI